MSGIGFSFPPDLSGLTSAVSQAALSASQATAAAAAKGVLPATIAAGGALPFEVSALPAVLARASAA